MHMTIASNQRLIILVMVAVLTSLLVLLLWFVVQEDGDQTIRNAQFAMASYSSIEELSAASDAVVIGTVNGVVGREVDYGTANPAERYGRGVPMVFHQLNVTETLKGETDKSIIVARMDTEQVSSGSVTPLRTDENVLLFLLERTHGEAPGITIVDHAYVTLSLDNGTFDVIAGDIARSRMPEVLDSPTYSLAEVREKVRGN